MPHELPQLIRVATVGSSSREAAAIRRQHRDGGLHRVAVGTYVPSETWSCLNDREQHLLLLRAVVPRLHPPVVVSHLSAAALHGWSTLARYPARLDVTAPLSTKTQHRRTVTEHSAFLRAHEVASIDGYSVTSAVRTAVDLAASLPFTEAVATLDHALHLGHVTPEQLLQALGERPNLRAPVAARRAIEFADKRTESVAESLCRVVLHDLGAPTPVLQREFWRGQLLLGRVDFFFEEQGVVLECDGLQKYREPRYLRGLSPAEQVIRERRRQQEVSAHPDVHGFLRCEWRDLVAPQRLRRILVDGGVPVA